MKAILLAGGKGTRLRPLTVHTPKPIVPIFDRPFLQYQLDLLRQLPEIDEVILSLNYQPRRIEEMFGDGDAQGVRLRYVVEPVPLGTAGAVKYAEQYLSDSVVVLNGDVMTAVDLPAVSAPASGAAREGDDRVDAGRESNRVRPGRDGRRGERAPVSGEAVAGSRSPATRLMPASTCSSRTPSTAFRQDTAWSIERSYFPSLVERGETFLAYVDRGYWIDIGTPAKYLQVHRDIMDGRFAAPPFADGANAAWIAADARVEPGAIVEGPCFVDSGAVVKAGARIVPYSVIGKQAHVEEEAVVDGAIVWANTWIGREATVRQAILGRNCHIGRSAIVDPGAVLGDKIGPHRLSAVLEHEMLIDPGVFKVYDVRGIYPREIDEAAAREIGRAFVAYLKPGGLPSGATCARRLHRSRPLSSTARARRARTSSTTG